ncbi:hypothetical protein BDV18DRAFT_54472 [Aspergillus unguis]
MFKGHRIASVRSDAAAAAQIMDSASVPNVLVGWLAIGLVGNEISINDVEFVIPDNLREQAKTALGNAGYTRCTDPKCLELHEDRSPSIDSFPTETFIGRVIQGQLSKLVNLYRYHPVPHAHYHLRSGNVLSLFRKSYYLWWLPDFSNGPPSPDDPHLALSNDARKVPTKQLDAWPGSVKMIEPFFHSSSSGHWPSELYPVRILTATTHIEALILLLCRDLSLEYPLDWRWFCQVNALGERRWPRQTRQGKKNAQYKLRPEFQEFWDRLRGHVPLYGEVNIFEPLMELRKKLIAENKLPCRPPEDPKKPPVFFLSDIKENMENIVEHGLFEGIEPWFLTKRVGDPPKTRVGENQFVFEE